MPFNNAHYSDLKQQLITALESPVVNKKSFEKKFLRLLNTHLKDISPHDQQLLCEHVYQLFQTWISALKKKDLANNDYEKARNIIYTVLDNHFWITALLDKNNPLRHLANACNKKMAEIKPLSQAHSKKM